MLRKITLQIFPLRNKDALVFYSTASNLKNMGSMSTGKKTMERDYYWLSEKSQWKNHKDLTAHLLNNVLYKDDYIVAFNKPNGIPMHAPKYDEKSEISSVAAADFLSLSSCKADIARELGVPELLEVVSQNRLHSGVVVFCFNELSKSVLSRYFRNARTNKMFISLYNLICVGAPGKTSDTNTFRIAQKLINNISLSIQLHNNENNGFKRRKDITAATSKINYETIDVSKIAFNCSTSHLRVLPSCVKWDALELFGVNRLTPILGDHKYSSRVRTILDRPMLLQPDKAMPEPQDLPEDICQILGVTREHSGDVPLHIHCSKFICPVLFKSRNEVKYSKDCLKNTLDTEVLNQASNSNSSKTVYGKFNALITAPLPPFYLETIRRLNLSRVTE